jgi:hypothetical protein
MSKFFLAAALAVLLCAGSALWPALAADGVPDLSSKNSGWDGDGENEFTPPKSGPGPVTSDPAHPYVSNFAARRTGEQPNWRIADLSNPVLKPWGVDAVRKQNKKAFSGKAMFTREPRCCSGRLRRCCSIQGGFISCRRQASLDRAGGRPAGAPRLLNQELLVIEAVLVRNRSAIMRAAIRSWSTPSA